MNPDGNSPKPTITRLDAEHREMTAAAHAAREASAQGGDPTALDAMMQAQSGAPSFRGWTLKGLRHGGYTAANLVALQLLSDQYQPDAWIKKAVGTLVVFMDPAKAWAALKDGTFDALVDAAIIEHDPSVADIGMFNRFISKYTKPESELVEETFPKPVMTPAAVSPA